MDADQFKQFLQFQQQYFQAMMIQIAATQNHYSPTPSCNQEMALCSAVGLRRLELQIYEYFPDLQRCSEQIKQKIRNKLKRQLLQQSEYPKVLLERYHVTQLLVNIERNLQKCRNNLGIIETSNDAYEAFQRTHQMTPAKPPHSQRMAEAFSSEDEYLDVIAKRGEITPQHDGNDSENLPLAQRKPSRKRQRDFWDTPRSNCSSASTTTGSRRSTRYSYKNIAKVSRSDSMDDSMMVNVCLPTILQDDQQKLEISIDLSKIDIARQVLKNKIKRIASSEQTRSSVSVLQKQQMIFQREDEQEPLNITPPEQADSFSRLVSEVLVEPNSIETLQATNALENINNNIDDNYNSNKFMSTTQANTLKKTTKKRAAKVGTSPKPPKKRGRKLGSKNVLKISQENRSPEGVKSDLAKYVELFSNDCDLASNAPTSAGTASTSHQIVTSTTQSYEETGQTSSDGTQTAQITYLLNGDWTSGGTCQLVSSANIGNIISLDAANITQDDFNYNTPFEDFVNYIDSSNNDIGNNVIARVLDGNNIAAPNSNMTDANNIMAVDAGNTLEQIRKPSLGKFVNPIRHQTKFSDYNNHSAFIANLQNPTLAHTIKSLPPPAHSEVCDVALDLSRNSETFTSSFISEEQVPIDNCVPIDLSLKSQTKNSQPDNNADYQQQLNSPSNNVEIEYNSVENNQPIIENEESDDNFIKRLIESSEFNSKNTSEHGDLQDDSILEINESFRAALDMPLLDNDENSQKNNNSDTYNNCLIENPANEAEISRSQDVHNLMSPTHKSYYQSENSLTENETSKNQVVNNLVSPTQLAYKNHSENTASIFTDFTKNRLFCERPNIETNIILNEIFLYPNKNKEGNFDSDASTSTAVELVGTSPVATEQSSDLRDLNTNDNSENNSMNIEIKSISSKLSVNDEIINLNTVNMSNQDNAEKLNLLTNKDGPPQILEETEVIVGSDKPLNNVTNERTLNGEILTDQESDGKVNETNLNNVDNKQETDIVEVQEKLEAKDPETSLSPLPITEQEYDLNLRVVHDIEIQEDVRVEELGTINAPIEDAQQEYDLNQNLENQIKENIEAEDPEKTEVLLPHTNYENENFESTLNQNAVKEIPNETEVELQGVEISKSSSVNISTAQNSKSDLVNQAQIQEHTESIISNQILNVEYKENVAPENCHQNTENSLKSCERKNLIPKIIIKATKITDDGTAHYVIKKPESWDIAYCEDETIQKGNALSDQHSKEQKLNFIEQDTNDNVEDVFRNEISEIKNSESITHQKTENCNIENAEVENCNIKNAEIEVNDNNTVEVVAINNCEIPDTRLKAEKENCTTDNLPINSIQSPMLSANDCEISNIQLQAGKEINATAVLDKSAIKEDEETKNTADDDLLSFKCAKGETLNEISNTSNKNQDDDSNTSSSSSNDSNKNMNKREFEGIICNSTSKGDKTQKPTKKVQIFSIIEKDSFDSANEDDDEFIRRTLKLYSKTDENVGLHGKTCNDEPTKISDSSNSTENTYLNEDINAKSLTDIESKSEIVIDNKNFKTSMKTLEGEFETIDLTISTRDDLDEIIFKDATEDENESVKAMDFTLKRRISVNNTENDIMTNVEEGDNTAYDDGSDNAIAFNLPNNSEEATSFEKDIQKYEFMKRLNLIDQEDNKGLEILEDYKNELEKDDENDEMQQSPTLQNTNYKNESHDHVINEENGKELFEEFEGNKTTNSFQTINEESASSLVTTKQEISEKNITGKGDLSTSNKLFLSNLSVLEMERQLDDSYLDFENHLDDDALSLSTSCFNSPDDDRFTNSLISDDPDKTNTTLDIEDRCDVTEEKPIDKSLIKVFDGIVWPKIAGLPSAEEKSTEFSSVLKKFKIPKVFKTEQISRSDLPQAQLNQSQLPPPPLLAGIKPTDTSGSKKIGLEKLTRTVQNVCAVPPLTLKPPPLYPIPNSNLNIYATQRNHDLFTMAPSATSVNSINLPFELMRDQNMGCALFSRDILNPPVTAILNSNSFVNMSRGQFAGRGGEGLNRGIAVLDIAKIFGVTCLPYLVNTCKILDSPQHNHQLRDPNQVKGALEVLSKNDLNVAYRFMINHTKLFCSYFYTFCGIYASQNNRSRLMNMVYDCEKHPRCIVFLRAVFYSLINCGLSKVNACRQILSRCRDMSPTSIDVLISIIFETDWTMFCDYLERYAETPQYSFRINVLSEMAPRVLRTKDPRLSELIFKCLIALNPDDLKLVEQSPDLMQLLNLMKDGKVC